MPYKKKYYSEKERALWRLKKSNEARREAAKERQAEYREWLTQRKKGYATFGPYRVMGKGPKTWPGYKKYKKK